MGSGGGPRQETSPGVSQQLYFSNTYPGDYAAGTVNAPQQFFIDYNTGATFQAESQEQVEEYMRYMSINQREEQPQVAFGDPGSVFVQSDYGPRFAFTSQGGQYPAYATAVGPDGQIYNATQGFAQYPGQVFQQPLSPATPYIAVSQPVEVPPAPGQGGTPVSGVEGSMAAAGDSSAVRPAGMNTNAVSGQRIPVVMTGPGGYAALPSPTTGPQGDFRRFDSLPRAGPWVDMTKMSQGVGTPASGQQAASGTGDQRQQQGLVRTISQTFQPLRPLTPLQLQVPSPQLQRLPSSITPSPHLLLRGMSPTAMGHRGVLTNLSPTFPPQRGLRDQQFGYGHGRVGGGGGGNWGDKGGRGRGSRGSGFFQGSQQEHNENRGPRGLRGSHGMGRPQRAVADTAAAAAGTGSGTELCEGLGGIGNREQLNRADFDVAPPKARFFVIKSYSEDDVHKSIKYNIWASTANGNRRLDQAFSEGVEEAAAAAAAGQEGEGEPKRAPVYLFFSVNASGQFCGVAEMIAPVDFSKSVEYWQQEKWSGHFKVCWHFIKDVPNQQFRHIILENNDGKPVTNSRDTQEVKYEQGLEMLSIYKNFVAKTSILDDFAFYDQRQKVMQDKRAMRQQQQQHQQQQRAKQGGTKAAAGGGSSATTASAGSDALGIAADEPTSVKGGLASQETATGGSATTGEPGASATAEVAATPNLDEATSRQSEGQGGEKNTFELEPRAE